MRPLRPLQPLQLRNKTFSPDIFGECRFTPGKSPLPGSFRFDILFMNLRNFLWIFATALLSGCGEKSNSAAPGTNAPTADTTPANAPGGYLGAMGKAQQNAVKTVDTTSVNQAIQLFNVDQARNPKDLNELVEKKYLPMVPTPPPGSRLEYDANAGTVKVVKQ
jgi:hypothetical protein